MAWKFAGLVERPNTTFLRQKFHNFADPLKWSKLLAGKFMYFTYVLLCVDNKRYRTKFYVGSTKDLKKRIQAHESKSTKTTKSFDKIQLMYFEACFDKTDAVIRENQLKTGFGRGYIKRRLTNHLKDISAAVV